MADGSWVDGQACADLVVGSESVGLALVDAAARIVATTAAFVLLTGLRSGEALLASVASAHRGIVTDLLADAPMTGWRTATVTFQLGSPTESCDRRISARASDAGVMVAVEHAQRVDDHVHERLVAVHEELAEAHRQLRSSQLVIRKLEGLLPVCAWCRRVRSDDDTHWLELDQYLIRRDAVKVTHSICPRCADVVGGTGG